MAGQQAATPLLAGFSQDSTPALCPLSRLWLLLTLPSSLPLFVSEVIPVLEDETQKRS